MVAKKTAVQQPASGRSTGPAAKDVGGKKSTQGAAAVRGTRPVKTTAEAPTETVTETANGAVARKAAVRKAGVKKAAATKTVIKKPATKKQVGKPVTKPVTKKTAARKTVAEKVVVEKVVAEKTVGRRTAEVKPTAEEAGRAAVGAAKGTTKKTGAKSATKKGTSTAKRSTGTAKKSTVKKTVASAAEGAAQAAKTTGATTVVAKKTPGTATAATKPTAVPKSRIAAVEPGELAVRPGEDPWTPQEVAEARAELQSEALRLGTEISSSEQAIVGLMRDSGDGAGDDQADTGTKNITREHEMALAANAREMLEQTERALERLDAGTYGLCENCGNPIGKARMQAFPRATLCVGCKQKQERR
ncbi:TraR/DksA C4-type zinc finger protein [Streptomyces sp. NPDC048275]|uniref:TraR/DksA C4-type zinc finger protein n=1 Tax=Streptomyces sp. NPDC048275 TaxID=3155629 RepID=UPI00340EB209